MSRLCCNRVCRSYLRGDGLQIVIQLVFGCTNISLPFRLKPWTSCSSENLQDVQHRQINPCASRAVVDLCALDYDCNLIIKYEPRMHLRYIPAWAGRLTPQARVAVQQRTLRYVS
jgi:hypothetical protein